MKTRNGWISWTSWLGWTIVLVAAVSASAWASEPGCYRTEDAAAEQVGVRGVEGFRLEGVHRDVFSGASWATVKSCQHPERPGVLVLLNAGARGAGSHEPASEAAAARPMVVLAGSRVRLVISDAVSRMEVSAVAQTSAALGDRVRVRLVAVSGGGGSDAVQSWGTNERFAVGVVKSTNLVEVEAR